MFLDLKLGKYELLRTKELVFSDAPMLVHWPPMSVHY
jgi:hypothetical protein